jgi:hypothetical protein
LIFSEDADMLPKLLKLEIDLFYHRILSLLSF